MKKRLYYAIAATLVFFSLGMLLDFGTDTEDYLQSYVERINDYLHKRESELEKLLRDEQLTNPHLEHLQFKEQQRQLQHLSELLDQPFNLTIYDQEKLQIWLNNMAIPDSNMVRELLKQGEVTRFVQLRNGYYEIIKRNLPDGRMAVGFIPIKAEYAISSKNLQNRFFAEGAPIPEQVFVSRMKTKFPIVNKYNKTLAWIDATPPIQDRQHLVWVFICYLLGFIALAVIINELSLKLARRYQPWVGAAFMLATVIGLRWFTVEIGFAEHFESFDTFKRVFEAESLRSMDSLGEMLINILLLLWMMVFFNREFQIKQYSPPYKSLGLALCVLHFLAINLGMVMVTKIFRIIIVESNIVFDFENVFALDIQSILAIVGIIFLLLSLFLFSHRMMLAIHNMGLPSKYRYAAMAISLLLAWPVFEMGQLGIAWYFFFLAAAFYLFMFDMFTRNVYMGVGWLVLWLMYFSSATMLLLYKFNLEKDITYRQEMARALTDFEDPDAEQYLALLSEKLQDSIEARAWNSLIEAYAGATVPKELAREIVLKKISESKYLLHNYTVSVSGFFYNDGTTAFTEQMQTMGQMEQLFREAAAKSPQLAFLDAREHEPGYLLRVMLPTEKPLLLFLRFKRSFSEPSKVYTELLLDKQYKNLEKLQRYDYGIFRSDTLIEEFGKPYPKTINLKKPGPDAFAMLQNNMKRSELIYQSPDNISIIIGRDIGGISKAFSLFSYVFVLLTVGIVLFSGINYYLDALPGPLNFLRNTRPSLRKQFQMWIIGMILMAFLGIGYVTVYHFQNSSEQYLQGRLERKVSSALANVSYELKSLHRKGNAASSWQDNEQRSLSSLVPLLSDVHQLDVNIYGRNGYLITSSEEDIFRKGLVEPIMGFYAYQELERLKLEKSSQIERIGEIRYQAAYVPVNDLNGNAIAFMGIPYYAIKRELASDVTAFMSALLNVYVFMLLITGGLAIFIANNVTKALSELSAGIQRLRLGYNEPIEWKRNDEIGDLVQAYNNALKKIEESSRLLAQSEREGAWREMAKQVAHEIKNPLTPMKLSIQYLQHAKANGVQNLEELIQRVSETLVEQIEALARIATEFSSFAKMPKAENSLFSLNELARSVHTLFANERLDMQISLYLPDKDFIVYADRNHLTRVLNNLFKNAIQAIPDGRPGVIEVSLRQDKNMVVVEVSDNGSGIPEDIREKVFVPNFSTKSSGTGLGLAICKNIVETAGGNIYFTTETGIGTTFFVELPIAEVREVKL
ncbi:MAG: HAMP domain-containing sensor histidine kinase [Saprospiraceae bacterium]